MAVVDRRDSIYSLELDDELTLDREIDPITAIQPVSSVLQRQWHLPFISDAVPVKLEPETFFVRRFQQTWAELAVNSDCRPDDPPRQTRQLDNSTTRLLGVLCASAVNFPA